MVCHCAGRALRHCWHQRRSLDPAAPHRCQFPQVDALGRHYHRDFLHGTRHFLADLTPMSMVPPGDDMAPFDSVTARLILLLAETGSIGRAAEREGIASSAVSRRVSDLESRLGVVLFDRSAQGVRLTSAGEAYAEGCRTVLRAIGDLDLVMADFGSGLRGSLRLACTGSALTGRLPELLARYAQKYPGISISIGEMGAAKALLALDE